MKTFFLSDYIQHLGDLVTEVSNLKNFEVSDVSNNSLKITSGSIFAAIKGSENDGHKYISDAVSKGAKAVIHTDGIAEKLDNIIYIRVEDSYFAYALLCEKYFDEPAKKLKMLGVTGTNGKTTSAYLLRSVLQTIGKKVGLVSTVEYSFGDTVISADRTTPEAYELQKLFYGMAENECEYCVMEVSSHALDQRRTGSARFDRVIFTNLSGDHLDYHKNMENYFLAKERLFSEYLKKDGKAVVNIDDVYGKRLAETCGATTFGVNQDSKYRIIHSSDLFERCLDGISFNGNSIKFSPHLLGLFNAYNVAGVFALCSELGLDKKMITGALSERICVPGRLERVYGKENVLYFVDYAHTDDALKRVLTALRELKPRRLISVFGCGGNRDKTKRPRMGKVSAELADFTIITSDNPRREIPADIIKDILAGISITGVPPVRGRLTPSEDTFHIHGQDARDTKNCFKAVEDRREAIFEAVRMAEEKDIVLIAGKGHEDYQEIMGVKYPFSDKIILTEAIRLTGVPPVSSKVFTDRSIDPHGQDARGTVKRRYGAYLPHWSQDEACYSITFRLADSLPEYILRGFLAERGNIIANAEYQNRELTELDERKLNVLYSQKIENYLNSGHGECLLSVSDTARIVQDTLLHFNGERYNLAVFCIMPNHVHVMIQPFKEFQIKDILHSWKSYSAKKINEKLGRTGAVWQTEYYDHLIRDEKDFCNQMNYILDNPKNAGLKNWPWVCRSTGVPPVKK